MSHSGKPEMTHEQNFFVRREPDPTVAPTTSIWERIGRLFADANTRTGRGKVSPHANGRRKPEDWRQRRKIRRKMAKASRKRNRGQ